MLPLFFFPEAIHYWAESQYKADTEFSNKLVAGDLLYQSYYVLTLMSNLVYINVLFFFSTF